MHACARPLAVVLASRQCNPPHPRGLSTHARARRSIPPKETQAAKSEYRLTRLWCVSTGTGGGGPVTWVRVHRVGDVGGGGEVYRVRRAACLGCALVVLPSHTAFAHLCTLRRTGATGMHHTLVDASRCVLLMRDGPRHSGSRASNEPLCKDAQEPRRGSCTPSGTDTLIGSLSVPHGGRATVACTMHRTWVLACFTL